MQSKEIQERFIKFFVRHNHLLVPQVSLVPENDPTLLFTSAGMVQFKPYFLGLEKPPSLRLVNIQRCLRTTDIDQVGSNGRTLSFFEMLGSWSIGDYFKEEAIRLAWQFLTKELNLLPEKLWATYFSSDKKYPNLPSDEETPQFWAKVGMDPKHIIGLGYEENFWRVGDTGPCGPCTEVYLDLGEKFGCGRKGCQPGCSCDRFLEIWNAGVFMEYNQSKEGKYEDLPIKSVDTGAGLERLAMVLQNEESVFETDLFKPLIRKISSLASRHWKEDKNTDILIRQLADHIKAITFMVADGVIPANIEQGYVLRRLIRKMVYFGQKLAISESLGPLLIPAVVNLYQDRYPYLVRCKKKIISEFVSEEKRFLDAVNRGRKEMAKIIAGKKKDGLYLSGKEAFYLLETFGLPVDLVQEEFSSAGIKIEKNFTESFARAKAIHQKKSRAPGQFKGGLADHSQTVVKLHTTTHLLHQALRDILGNHVHQIGSNITAQRLRFDFPHPVRLTAVQIKQIEDLINKKITQNLPVVMEKMTLREAKKEGALAFFERRHDQDLVKVYTIGKGKNIFSKEVCGGPHVHETGRLGKFKVIREESVGSGKRRIYGILK